MPKKPAPAQPQQVAPVPVDPALVDLLLRGEAERKKELDAARHRVRRSRGDRRKAARRAVRKLTEAKGCYFPTFGFKASDSGFMRHISSTRIDQVVDKENMIVTVKVWTRREPTTFWLKGHPTESLVDDQHFLLPRLLHTTGTKQYNTAGGGMRTLLLVEPLIVDLASVGCK